MRFWRKIKNTRPTYLASHLDFPCFDGFKTTVVVLKGVELLELVDQMPEMDRKTGLYDLAMLLKRWVGLDDIVGDNLLGSPVPRIAVSSGFW